MMYLSQMRMRHWYAVQHTKECWKFFDGIDMGLWVRLQTCINAYVHYTIGRRVFK